MSRTRASHLLARIAALLLCFVVALVAAPQALAARPDLPEQAVLALYPTRPAPNGNGHGHGAKPPGHVTPAQHAEHAQPGRSARHNAAPAERGQGAAHGRGHASAPAPVSPAGIPQSSPTPSPGPVPMMLTPHNRPHKVKQHGPPWTRTSPIPPSTPPPVPTTPVPAPGTTGALAGTPTPSGPGAPASGAAAPANGAAGPPLTTGASDATTGFPPSVLLRQAPMDSVSLPGGGTAPRPVPTGVGTTAASQRLPYSLPGETSGPLLGIDSALLLGSVLVVVAVGVASMVLTAGRRRSH